MKFLLALLFISIPLFSVEASWSNLQKLWTTGAPLAVPASVLGWWSGRCYLTPQSDETNSLLAFELDEAKKPRIYSYANTKFFPDDPDHPFDYFDTLTAPKIEEVLRFRAFNLSHTPPAVKKGHILYVPFLVNGSVTFELRVAAFREGLVYRKNKIDPFSGKEEHVSYCYSYKKVR